MNMPFISKKRYIKDVKALEEIVKRRNLEIDKVTNESAIAYSRLIEKDSKISKLQKKLYEAREIDKIKSANVADLNNEINELIVTTTIEKSHMQKEINRMHAMAQQIYMLLIQNKKHPDEISKQQVEEVLVLMTKREGKVVKE